MLLGREWPQGSNVEGLEVWLQPSHAGLASVTLTDWSLL